MMELKSVQLDRVIFLDRMRVHVIKLSTCGSNVRTQSAHLENDKPRVISDRLIENTSDASSDMYTYIGINR